MPASSTDAIVIDRLETRPAESEGELVELRRRLLLDPRELSSRYFYDDRGSALFDRICELPEYYQTRTEKALLDSLAERLVSQTGACEVVELGAGSATKTRVLLDAMHRAGQLRRYVPLEVSDGTLERVASELVEEYEDLVVHGVVGDFMHHLGHLPSGNRRLILFLGGTIGNLRAAEAVALLKDLRSEMTTGDHFLLGVDLIKDIGVLEAAYNDSEGVTAAFNLNALRVVNRRFGGNFDESRFRHRAFYDSSERRIEMRLTSTCRQRVSIQAIELDLELEADEEIRTEISTKYDQPRLEELLQQGGFELVDWFTDPKDLFGLALSRIVP